MIDILKRNIFKKYSSDELKGLFLSGYDSSGKILFSNGVLNSDKPLGELIDYLYYLNFESNKDNIADLVIDIVIQNFEVTNPQDILSLSMKDYGLYVYGLSGNQGGIMLPNTSEVADVRQALQLVKSKNSITDKVKVFAFKTDRIVI
ncbi:MAG: hypothetical protein V3575_02095 [Candidatus Absconditabacteria bacterium]